MKTTIMVIITVSFLFLISDEIKAQYLTASITETPVVNIGAEYFPLDTVTTLLYESTFGETTCTTRFNGKGYMQEFRSDDFEMYQLINIIDDKFSVISLDQEIDVFLFITHSISVTYSEPAELVSLPLLKDEEWTWTGIEYVDDNVDTVFISTVYSTDEVITTEAGEFNCKRVDYVIRKSSGKVTRYKEWRAPGVGLVKLEAVLDPKGFAGTIQSLLGYDEIYFTLKAIR